LSLALLAGLALAVSPAHATLTAPGSRTIDVRNTGSGSVIVEVRTAAPQWLQIRPKRLVLHGGAHGALTVRARASARARPGDHELIVRVLARPPKAVRIAVRMQLGVRLRVRVPGRLVRRVVVRGLHVRRTQGGRVLLVALANDGNVTEQLHGRVTVALLRGRRLLSRLRYRGTREVFPDARAVVALPYAGGARGLVTAIVRVRAAERRYRLRL
jgi:hypothetical protein